MMKRGTIEDMVNVFMVFAFALLFILFIILFRAFGGNLQQVMISSSETNDAQAALLTFMRTPVTVYGEEMELSELIARATLDENYRRIVRSEINKVISPSSGIPVYEIMVEYPLGSGIDPSYWQTVDTQESFWRAKTSRDSYYVGSSSGSREWKGELVFPNHKGKKVNVTIYRNSVGYDYLDLFRHGLYPGELIEDGKGHVIVAWSGRLVKLGMEGIPCASKIEGDEVKCVDGSDPDKLISLSSYLKSPVQFDSLQANDPDYPPVDKKVVMTLEQLRSIQIGTELPLHRDGKEVTFIAWGKSRFDSYTYYFAQKEKSIALCRKLVPDSDGKAVAFGDSFVSCGGKPVFFENKQVLENPDLFISDVALLGGGYTR